MRKLIVAAFISLDGVMQAPGGPEEDTSGGFAFGGWTVPHADAGFGAAMSELFAQPFDLVLGRRTWDIFAGHWPRVPEDGGDAGLARLFNATAKHVATHRGESLDWHNSHALGDDVIGAVRALKAQDGPVLLTQGSSLLVQQLLASDLVDEVRLLTFPVLLGAGKRLFDGHALPASFALEHGVVSPNGIVITRYVRQGAVETGSFALE
ncbi:dihydrofolate reductase [Xanthomonas sp. Mitacek01]|nr:dihydrofolate reductase [Xanthomonas sp. Mitacek01]